MENQRLKELAGLLTEKEAKWSADVKAKWTPAAGFFSQSHTEIVKGLLEAPGGAKKASARLNFYINRAGSKLEGKDKERLEKAKDALEKKLKSMKEEVAAVARRAGIVLEKKGDDDMMDMDPDMDMGDGDADAPADDKAPKADKKAAPKKDDDDEDDLPKIVKKIAKTTCKKFKLGDAKGEGKECDEIEKLLMQVYNAGLKDGEKGGAKPKADKKDDKKDDKAPKMDDMPPAGDDDEMTESFNLEKMSDAEIQKAHKKYSSASGKGGKAEEAHKRVSAELKKRGLKADIFKAH